MRLPVATAIVPVDPPSPTASAPPATSPSIPRREPAGVVLGDEPLRDRDRAAAAPCRARAGRLRVAGERPRERGAVELDLEGVLDAARRERLRLAAVRLAGREFVLGRWRLDGGAVLVLVAPVGEVLAAVELLDAFEDRDHRLGLRRHGRLAAVLVYRLPGLGPVVAREGLELVFLSRYCVGRDDVAPVFRRVDGPRVIEVAAVEVAVVGDRRLVGDVGIRVRARRVADPDLLLRLGVSGPAPAPSRRTPRRRSPGPIVPVPPVERRRIVRPRVLDHEGRHDVLPVPTMALRVGAVEVRLRRVCRLVGAVGEVAEADRVLVIAVAALRRHRGNHGEQRRAEPGGEIRRVRREDPAGTATRGHVADRSTRTVGEPPSLDRRRAAGSGVDLEDVRDPRPPPGRVRSPAMATSLVTGGAGFLGSHLCEALLEKGHRVLCLDNLETGSLANVEHLRDDAFTFVHHDVSEHDPRRRAARLRLPPRGAREPDRLPAAARCTRSRPGRTARTTRSASRSGSGRGSCSPRRARSTAIRRSTRSPRPTGATSTRSARAASTTRRSATPRR